MQSLFTLGQERVEQGEEELGSTVPLRMFPDWLKLSPGLGGRGGALRIQL